MSHGEPASGEAPRLVVRLIGLMLGVLLLRGAQMFSETLFVYGPLAVLGATMGLAAVVGDAAKFVPSRRLAVWVNRLTFGVGNAARLLDEMAANRFL